MSGRVAAVPATRFPGGSSGQGPTRKSAPPRPPRAAPPLSSPFPPPPSLLLVVLLLLLLLLGVLPRFLSSLLHLSGTFSDYLLVSVSPGPSLRRPAASSQRGQISKRQSCPRGGARACRGGRAGARRKGTAGEGWGRAGVFLTRGSSSSCKAERPHPRRQPRGAFPGDRAAAASPSPPPSPRPSPGLPPRARSCPHPSVSPARGRDYLGLRQLLGGGAGLAASGSLPVARHPAAPPAGSAPQPGSWAGPVPTPAPWGAGSGRRHPALAAP